MEALIDGAAKEFTLYGRDPRHFPIQHSVAVHEALSAAGEPLGMVNFGLLATESMRLEKNYRAWKQDLHTEFTVLEAGLGRFVDLDKDFRGRDAIVAERTAGDRRRFVAPEAGACLGVLELLVAERAIHPDERVVIFNTGAAQKYVEVMGSGTLPHLPRPVDWGALSS